MRWLGMLTIVFGMVAAVPPAGGPRAAVTVVDDEVIFSLTAPAASEVFLVGDFNNWNPTLQIMDEIDGRFETYVFLQPGTYRYKFVVDGRWITDPDNPPAVPEDGSLLVLEQRAGMLTIGVAEEPGDDRMMRLEPSGRYSGAFDFDDNKTSATQALDVYVDHASEHVTATMNLKTTDDTWDVSPLTAEINFDRGHIDLLFGEGVVRGFENDSTWTSSDPFAVFGQVGVYDYSAGYERRGLTLEMPLVLKTRLDAIYADKIGARLGPPLTVGFAGTGAPASVDTTVYRKRDTYEDADTWGFELSGDLGSVRFGYTKRENRGFNPGVLVEAEPNGGGGVVMTTYTTREFFSANAFWLRWAFWRGFAVRGGYGRGDADIETQDRSVALGPTLPFVTIGQSAEPFERRFSFQDSRRIDGALEYVFEAGLVRVGYQWNEYDFELGVPSAGGVPAEARSAATPTATIQIATLEAEIDKPAWTVRGGLEFIDQDYGAAPAEFSYFTPARNFWLDYRDELTMENMVAFDERRATQLSVTVSGNERLLPAWFGSAGDRPTEIRVTGGITTSGFFETLEYGVVRFGIEHTIANPWYAQWDSRLAWYNKPSWRLEDTFFSMYVEAGHRRSWGEISVGLGLDPHVLDPVRNQYSDIGREEFLREALFEGLTRDDAALLGARLAERERRLADSWPIKLEVILFF